MFLEETIKPPRHTSVNSSEGARNSPSIRSLLTPPVVISIINYCVSAFMGVCVFPLLPLFYSTPIEIGGLGLDPFQIAICLSGYGIANGVIQILFFCQNCRKVRTQIDNYSGHNNLPVCACAIPDDESSLSIEWCLACRLGITRAATDKRRRLRDVIWGYLFVHNSFQSE